MIRDFAKFFGNGSCRNLCLSPRQGTKISAPRSGRSSPEPWPSTPMAPCVVREAAFPETPVSLNLGI